MTTFWNHIYSGASPSMGTLGEASAYLAKLISLARGVFLPVKIGFWYLSTMILIGILFWHMPDKYRFCSALAKPVFLQKPSPRPQHPDIVIIGDCTANAFPLSAFKIWYLGSDLTFIAEQIRDASPIKLKALHSAKHIVILATNKGREKTVPTSLMRLLPNKSISFVPADEIMQISKEHGDGLWHLDKTGYDVLLFRYPDLLPPMLN